MSGASGQARDRAFGWAWVLFAAVLATHVLDEAAHDFLSFYNPNVLAIRARLPWFPLPTFSFQGWLFGLLSAVVLLATISPFAFRGKKWLRNVAVPLGLVIGILNGTLHLISSTAMRRFVPGVFSSPFLIIAGALLIWSARRNRNEISPLLKKRAEG